MSAEALEGSIKKWERIVKSTKGKDNGIQNCPLCEKYYDNNCRGCPVEIKTGGRCCANSPHQKWSDHMEDEHDSCLPITREPYCKVCLKLAKAELVFLESLREIYKEA